MNHFKNQMSMETQVFISSNFCLRSKQANKPTPIYFVTRIKGKQYKISTGVKVYPSQWSREKQLAVESNLLSKQDNRNNKVANKKITAFKDRFSKYIDYICNADYSPNIGVLRSFLNKTNAKEEIEEVKLIINKIEKQNAMENKIDVIDILLRAYEERYSSEGKKESTKLTIYNSYLKPYIDYVRENKLEHDISVFSQLGVSAYYEKIKDNGNAFQTIKNKVGVLVNLINNILCKKTSFIKELGQLTPVISPVEAKQTNDGDKYLTIDEIDQIRKCQNLTSEEKIVWDFMLNFQLVTATRIGDAQRIIKIYRECGESGFDIRTASNGRKFIVFLAKKEDTKKIYQYIPYTEDVKRFLENSKIDVNKTLNSFTSWVSKNYKSIAEKSNLTAIRYKNEPIYENIASHWLKHTMTTIYRIKGLSVEETDYLTAHKPANTMTEHYTHMPHEVIIEKLANAFDRIEKEGNQNVEPAKPTESDAHEELFSYSSIKQIKGLLDNKNISVINLPIAKQAINVIKDVSKLGNFKEIDFEKIKEISPVIFELSYLFYDSQLYLIYQYKLKHFGLPSDGYWDSFFNSEDDIAYIFQRKDEEEKTDTEIESYENSHR